MAEIAITITEENKELNELSNAVGSIMKQSSYPNKWVNNTGVVYGYPSRDDLHDTDGWKDVVQPTIGANQKRGAIYYDDVSDVFTYQVIDKTVEEIQSEQIAASEAVKEQRVKEISDSLVLEGVYNETDIETVLDNIDLYPSFEVGIAVLNEADAPNDIPYRCKDFDDDNELVLWEAVQSHTTQADWRPKDVPALFKRVALAGEIPVWIQPLGAFDAYELGGQVHFPTINDPIYESTFNGANVWAPNVFGWVLA
jgi:hypothetical protein